MSGGKIGANTGTIVRPRTEKQKQDRKKRLKRQKERRQYIEQKIGKLIGNTVYTCTHCKNKIRTSEDLSGRNVLCSKCNNGFYRP
jgi:hypothetical protein